MHDLPPHRDVRLQVGLIGYEQRQTTVRFGTGVNPEASRERYVINALGLAVNAAFPKQRASLGLEYFNEFANRSTYQGYSFQAVGAIAF
jgi:hypothetical protein